MFRVEIPRICVRKIFLGGGQNSGLSSGSSWLLYVFVGRLEHFIFRKSCHGYFAIVCVFFCDTLLVGYWPALIPKVSFSLSGNPRSLLFSINLEKHFCWSVNYNLVFISRRSLESSPYIIVEFIAIIFSYQF